VTPTPPRVDPVRPGETGVTLEDGKALVRHHFDEFVNRRNHDIVYETLSDNFLDHDGPDGLPTDREGDRRMMVGMHAVLPDLHVVIEDLIAEGDRVVCRNVWRGTRAGGHEVEFRGIVIWRLAHGKIVERWARVDGPQ